MAAEQRSACNIESESTVTPEQGSSCIVKSLQCPEFSAAQISARYQEVCAMERALLDKQEVLTCCLESFQKRHQRGGKKIKKELQLPVQEKIQTLNMSENGHNKVRNLKCQFFH